ncbi:hypothetical protein ACFOD9_09460 [Novosphingobium bradum]|uniref:Uncharacterized protein n=1 Tax=Novosphingobium bradum TaxID=1737444 RepID=A0ABV7ISB9_9SPHN
MGWYWKLEAMVGGVMDGDRIVALLGVVMAMVLVSGSVRVRALTTRQRWLIGALWAVIFGVVAGLAGLLGRGSP